MVIIQLQSGLGNQMFQYALYKSFEKLQVPVKIDEVSFPWADEFNWLGLDKQWRPFLKEYFGINYQTASLLEVRRSRYKCWFLPPSLRSKLFLDERKTHFIENGGPYDPAVFELRNAYVTGYFQSEQYFQDEDVQNTLRSEFLSPLAHMDSPAFCEWKEKIARIHSASMHLRRCDYLHDEKYTNICTDEYYDKAMQALIEHDSDIRFFVFSDDPLYAKEHYIGERFEVVHDDRLSDLEEFYLMYLCKHHILANSSFSWWSTWLDDDPTSIVLAPDRWINGLDWDKIYTPRMRKIAV